MTFLPLVCDHRCSFHPAKRLRRRPLAEAFLLVLSAGPLSAATIAVNSTADGTLATLAGNVTCDLREAIAAANGNLPVGSCPGDGAGLDTITLAGIAGQTITLSAGQLTINSDVTLQGQGVTIDGNSSGRVFTIGNNATTTLSSLTVQNGSLSSSNGGGIYVDDAIVSLTNSTISGNSARISGGVGGYGGGIHVANATVSLTNSTISGNSAFRGGGLYVDDATVGLANSTVSDNTARFGCGGIRADNGAVVNLTNSTVSDNTTRVTAGVCLNNGTILNLTNSTISGNSALGGGGGIDIIRGSTANLTNSTISGNTGGFGGGVFLSGGAIDNVVINLTNSTISGNIAGVDGGGIFANPNSTVSLTNSTISGNTATGNGGGVYARGNTTMINVTNSIISSNTANYGGGISTRYNPTINLTNSILANNTANSSGLDLNGDAGVITTLFSLIGTDLGSGSLTINQGAGSQVGSPGPIDPLLGPLQNNGGPTETHALLLGSPAIDAGSNALALDLGGSPLSTDQRGTGFPRILDGDTDATATVDLGAVEFPALQNVNPSMGAMLSNQSLNMTLAPPEAPTGTFGFDVNFCNTAVGPGNNLSFLFSRTITLSNNNNLVSRSRDGTPPGGADSEQDFVIPGSGDYADGVLSPSECVVVNYQIGLSTLQQFAFIIDVFGSVQ